MKNNDDNTASKEVVNEFSNPVWEGVILTICDKLMFCFTFLCLLAIWAKGLAPGQFFDARTPSPVLVEYAEKGLIPNGRALVPGCGRGYDVTLLASQNRFVIGLEISSSAITAAEERLKDLPEEEFPYKSKASFELANFFDLSPKTEDEKFDFIYDYTFFCALDPTIRKDWAIQMGNLMKKNGILLTLIFPIHPSREGQFSIVTIIIFDSYFLSQKTGGPPFPVSLELYRELLEEAGFEMVELRDLPSEMSHPGRDGSIVTEGPFKGIVVGSSGVGRWRKL